MTAARSDLMALAEELREYTALKYMGNCKCGKCKLVPDDLVRRLCAALRLAASQPDREAVALINERLEDLAAANALYGKDNRLNAPEKVARNSREIAWLKDLRSTLLSGAGTKSDGGVEGHARMDACGLSDDSLRGGANSSNERGGAGIKPGPSDTPIADSSEAGRGGDPLDDLVARFSAALLAKLKAARVKYGYDEGWREPGWEADCQKHLIAHLAKGDPRDVAAYCAFMWHHGWITVAPALSAPVGEPFGYAWEEVVDPTGEVIHGKIVTRFATHWSTPPANADVKKLYTHPPAPAVGPDVREAMEKISNCLFNHYTFKYRYINMAARKDASEALARTILSALTRPLGGFVQGSIADCGQSNEQSGKQPSLKTSPELLAALERAKAHVMTPAERYEQRRSFTRGMCPSNRDYAEWCAEVDKLLPPLPAVAETDADAQRDDGLLSGGGA